MAPTSPSTTARSLSASPERFLRCEGRKVETRPIKGTRPRGATTSQDRALARQLARSGKDRAENLMIVDLLRNDLGKVCQVGTIQVPELFELEGYASVWHLVCTVRGTVRPELTAVDLLRGLLSGGIGHGLSEDQGHGDHRGAGGGTARRLLRRHRLSQLHG